MLLKPRYGGRLSNLAFKFNLRRYTMAGKLFRHQKLQMSMVGWCNFNPGAHTCPLFGFT
jgi:hypothetical protein